MVAEGRFESSRPRVMAVLNPIRLVVLNYPEGQTEMLTTVNNRDEAGTREFPGGCYGSKPMISEWTSTRMVPVTPGQRCA